MLIYELVTLTSCFLLQMSYNLSLFQQSLRLLGDASVSFEKNCVRGIQANHKRISQLLHEVTIHDISTEYLQMMCVYCIRCNTYFSSFFVQSLMLVTSLNPVSKMKIYLFKSLFVVVKK